MNILEKADQIVNHKSEEKERMYGDFFECMDRTAKLASIMTGKDITAVDMYKCMVAMKLSRESNAHKEDNLLDAVAYLGSMNDYIEKQNK